MASGHVVAIASGRPLRPSQAASAWLGVRDSARRTRWEPLLRQSIWVLPFSVVAEMRFGAEVAGWGARRRGVLERLVVSSKVMPPLAEVTDA